MTKHYYYDKIWERYRIRKNINGKRVNYGSYPTEQEVKLIVSELIKNNWDKTKLPEIKAKVKNDLQNNQT